MSQITLKTSALTKKYGKRVIIDSIDMTIQKGDIYGLIGRNGAGKTTFMRTCLGMANATSGEISFFGGENINKARKKVGALIENPAFYDNFSAKKNLELFATAFGADKTEVAQVLDYVELTEAANRKVKTYSLGMKQRLAIAIALLGKPEFLVLDEPINGLDPEGIKNIRDMILKLNQENGITFLISSHLLDELGRIATRYGIIEGGKLIEELSAEELEEKCRKKIIIEVDNKEKAVDVIKNIVDEADIRVKEDSIQIHENVEKIAEINKALVSNDINVYMLYPKNQNLENYFMERIGVGNV